MKMQADRPEGSNAITRHGRRGRDRQRRGISPQRARALARRGGPWAVDGFEALDEASFEAARRSAPELVIFGSGSRIRFPKPALLRALMARRIGFETMDTPAACRTYNVLLAEGRAVVAALLFERGG